MQLQAELSSTGPPRGDLLSGRRGHALLTAAVLLIASLVLAWNLSETGIASGWIDPVAHFGAQDEATYTHEAIRMATQGNWLTPMLLGRWNFEKPPLLVWLSAVSIKLFGIGPLSVRIPAVLAGAAIVALCFALGRGRSRATALAAGALCLSNGLLFTMSRHNMTDILLAATATAILFVLASDPMLVRPGSQVAYILLLAACILTKSIAGLLPACAALVFAVLSVPRSGARLRRVVLLSVAGIALGSGWFLYHFFAHRDWFLADMGFQVLTVGIHPRQSSPENHIVFYLRRLIVAGPIACALFLSALPRLAGAVRRRDHTALLLASYLLVFSAALAAFGFHSEQYLTPLLPLVILAAVLYSPLLNGRTATVMAALTAAVFAIKAANPDQPWGLSYETGTSIPVAPALTRYCEERRSNELYVIDVADEFYALALPLSRLHYGWIDPARSISADRPHLVYLGIVSDGTAVSDRDLYRARLRAWGFDSNEPLGSGVMAPSAEQFAQFIVAHPDRDFLVSGRIAQRISGPDAHDAQVIAPDVVMLRSRVKRPLYQPGWTCDM